MTRVQKTTFTEHPWRIHEITRDFHVEDVWAFRTPGAGRSDFPVMLAAIQDAGEPAKQPWLVRSLFALRWKLGALLGWDRSSSGIGRRVASLRDRLPEDLRDAPRGKDVEGMPFTGVYELDTECASELANKTVHTVMHLGWVRKRDGEYRLQMTVLVKPNGLLGKLYLAAIAPFRYLVVYPAMTRQWERAWRERGQPSAVEGEPTS
ncbi:DUF2867 domain-containing protein [Saccharomonospora xinjiangensis]|uniref:DUF2867 domain-containing protein n=1 Tax=Saccharomonospora xinjiangensis TaxID=75294 RepID=UPI00106F9673|nr:DUF2867 domain-containing protein [Saccharomonospora xinjiangensis]QBQ59658.1 hypothetical protein EYD13_06445 [Saccharomonospora xinjiangensis]